MPAWFYLHATGKQVVNVTFIVIKCLKHQYTSRILVLF